MKMEGFSFACRGRVDEIVRSGERDSFEMVMKHKIKWNNYKCALKVLIALQN